MFKQENLSNEAKIAQFRFAVIAPVVQGLFADPSKTAYFKRVTEKPLKLPDGSEVKYSYKTVEKWAGLYEKHGMDGLMPTLRSDCGSTRVLPAEAIDEIYRLKEKYHRLNATQIYLRLVQESLIPATVNVSTVQRYIKNHDLKYCADRVIKDRKAFEMENFGELWQADTCYITHLKIDGKSRQVYAMCIIDDYSRMLVGARLFFNDNAENFQKVLKDAIAATGIPDKLFVDNGAPYSNEQLSLICGEVGIVLIHTQPRDGAAKAKIERQWRTDKERWAYGLDMEKFDSLEALNKDFLNYVREYNTRFHKGIETTPLSRWQATRDHARVPKSREWLDYCFLNRISRRVRKDATVSINRVSFDAPKQFISHREKVDIRYIPGDMSSAFILFEGKRYPLRKTNKAENGRTKRQNTIDYDKIGGDANDR